MKNIELIIFDLDGCMVHTQPDIALAFQNTAKAIADMDISLEFAGGLIGGGAKKAMERVFGADRPDLVEPALKYFKASYVNNCCELSTAYPGVIETLEHFKGKVKLAVATAKIRAATETILKKLGLFDYFDMLVCDEDMTKMKPDPECIHIILNKLNVQPEHAVMVGDMKTDVMAAKAANAGSVAVTYGYGKLEDIKSESPDYIVNDIRELQNIIEL
ncbi:MAG: HAD family hydrolase [Christensenellales bacterium]|jgi:phosphoglycolate phosphatase